MPKKEFELRCYAKKIKDNKWYAICIDLNLFAESDRSWTVREKLTALITDYLYEASTIDKDHYADLIPRKAPFYFIAQYWWLRLGYALGFCDPDQSMLYDEVFEKD